MQKEKNETNGTTVHWVVETEDIQNCIPNNNENNHYLPSHAATHGMLIIVITILLGIPKYGYNKIKSYLNNYMYVEERIPILDQVNMEPHYFTGVDGMMKGKPVAITDYFKLNEKSVISAQVHQRSRWTEVIREIQHDTKTMMVIKQFQWTPSSEMDQAIFTLKPLHIYPLHEPPEYKHIRDTIINVKKKSKCY